MCKYIYENFTQRPLKIVCVCVCVCGCVYGFLQRKKVKREKEERKEEERERCAKRFCSVAKFWLVWLCVCEYIGFPRPQCVCVCVYLSLVSITQGWGRFYAPPPPPNKIKPYSPNFNSPFFLSLKLYLKPL